MRYIFSVTILLLGFHLLQSQTLLQTKNGVIEFFSKTPVEDIYAKNSETSALLNPSTGETAFSLSVHIILRAACYLFMYICVPKEKQ